MRWTLNAKRRIHQVTAFQQRESFLVQKSPSIRFQVTVIYTTWSYRTCNTNLYTCTVHFRTDIPSTLRFFPAWLNFQHGRTSRSQVWPLGEAAPLGHEVSSSKEEGKDETHTSCTSQHTTSVCTRVAANMFYSRIGRLHLEPYERCPKQCLHFGYTRSVESENT